MTLQQPAPSTPTAANDHGWRPRGSERLEPGPARPAASSDAERLPRPPRRRNAGLAALAVLLVAGGAAVAGLLAVRIDDRVDVLVARTQIPAGTRITADQLAVAPVAASGLALLPARDLDSVVGKYAAVTVPAGRLLDGGMLSGAAVLRPGTVAIGVSLAPGQLPASGLRTGDRVTVYGTEGEGSVLATDVVVGSVVTPRDASFAGATDATVVSLVLPQKSAPPVAAASGAGKISVGLVSQGGAG